MGWDYMTNSWMGGWMWTPMVLVSGLLVLGTIAVIRCLSIGTPRESDDPLAIAARRFARSEMSKDEYDALRSTLSPQHTHGAEANSPAHAVGSE